MRSKRKGRRKGKDKGSGRSQGKDKVRRKNKGFYRAILNEPNFSKKNPKFQILGTCTQAFLQMLSLIHI